MVQFEKPTGGIAVELIAVLIDGYPLAARLLKKGAPSMLVYYFSDVDFVKENIIVKQK